MKKTFKFMAMALAAVVMAGVTVSCDPMDKDDDQQNEQTGGDQTGDDVALPTLEGKQWIYDGETPALFYDFGVKQEGKLYEGWYMSGMAMNVVSSDYVFDPVDATSGTVTLAGLPYYPEPTVIEYKNLTATTVEVDGKFMGFTPGEFLTMKVAETPITWEEE